MYIDSVKDFVESVSRFRLKLHILRNLDTWQSSKTYRLAKVEIVACGGQM